MALKRPSTPLIATLPGLTTEAISRTLRAMPSEEAYYWYSKCTHPHSGNRAQRALRVLLAAE